MARYQVSPIADDGCDSINGAVVLLETDSLTDAKHTAEHAPHAYGAGILDRETGKLDVGFGFGVPCPEIEA